VAVAVVVAAAAAAAAGGGGVHPRERVRPPPGREEGVVLRKGVLVAQPMEGSISTRITTRSGRRLLLWLLVLRVLLAAAGERADGVAVVAVGGGLLDLAHAAHAAGTRE